MLATPAGAVGILLGGLGLAAALLADVLAPFRPPAIVGPPLAAPSVAHLMGTDDLGRDLVSAVLHGARTSLLVAFGVGTIAVGLGTAIGLASGYLGGWVGDVLMRITELFRALPRVTGRSSPASHAGRIADEHGAVRWLASVACGTTQEPASSAPRP